MTNILVVDDNRFTAEALAMKFNILIKNSHIITAANGAEAVKVLESEPVDLVLTDLRMPVMNGYELLAYCRQHYPQVLTDAMTAEYTPEVLKRVHDLGAAVCFEKPFDFDDVVLRVRDQLGPVRKTLNQLSRLASVIAAIGFS